MQRNKGKWFVMAGVMAVLILVSGMADAATLEVGATKPYTTIQSAVDAAYNGDEIIVDAGTYSEFVVVYSKDNLNIHAYANPEDIDGSVANRVTVQGGFQLATAVGNVVQGFYVTAGPSGNIPTSPAAKGALDISGYNYSANNQWRDMVVYDVNASLAAVGGYFDYKWNQLYDVTIYDNPKAADFTAQSGQSVYNTIVAFNDDAYYAGTGYGAYVRYSNWYDNPNPTSGFGINGVHDSGGNIGYATGGSDPLFSSTNPADPDFLWLTASSPGLGTANDGGNMGALPLVPEPATMVLLAMAGTMVLRRRRK